MQSDLPSGPGRGADVNRGAPGGPGARREPEGGDLPPLPRVPGPEPDDPTLEALDRIAGRLEEVRDLLREVLEELRRG